MYNYLVHLYPFLVKKLMRVKYFHGNPQIHINMYACVPIPHGECYKFQLLRLLRTSVKQFHRHRFKYIIGSTHSQATESNNVA
jgi:hypothetical protein